MTSPKPPSKVSGASSRGLAKAKTGILGFDELTRGGLPRGRATLVCGGPGCGKTLFGMQFLLHGAQDFGEPGVFLAFEENAKELAENVASLGFNLDRLVAEKRLAIDHVHLDPREIHETGAYDLEGLFVRLALAIDSVGAKRIVLDTIETLFTGFQNEALVRGELRRLFEWLKSRGMTTVITGERGDGQLTRQGLEEYVSDCVIVLDHRTSDEVSTRRLRVVKYRGTSHGTNEYPFLIDEDGFSVLPVTELGLDHAVSEERVSTGVARLDSMLGGEGVYRGSSVLVSGTAGSGKTSMAAWFAHATCARGERCLYLAFEESKPQIIRNMRSVGLDLERWVRRDLLEIAASRPQTCGLETHLAHIYRRVREFDPRTVVLDPITSFVASEANTDGSYAMLLRLVDFLKSRGTTAVFVSLTGGGGALEASSAEISSLIDTWILLRDLESGGERNRGLYVLKARGTAHSNQIREFRITSKGIELLDVYTGPEGVLTGSLRAAQENREATAKFEREQESARRRRELDAKRTAMEARVAALRAEFAATEHEASLLRDEDRERESRLEEQRAAAGRRRGAEPPASEPLRRSRR